VPGNRNNMYLHFVFLALLQSNLPLCNKPNPIIPKNKPFWHAAYPLGGQPNIKTRP
jgi:hypothetical protein